MAEGRRAHAKLGVDGNLAHIALANPMAMAFSTDEWACSEA
jgi:hypothetical protein